MSDLAVPALPPPAGVRSNFEDAESRANLTIIPSAAIVGVMIIHVFARMYTKTYILKAVGWDDCASPLNALIFPTVRYDLSLADMCMFSAVSAHPSRSFQYGDRKRCPFLAYRLLDSFGASLRLFYIWIGHVSFYKPLRMKRLS